MPPADYRLTHQAGDRGVPEFVGDREDGDRTGEPRPEGAPVGDERQDEQDGDTDEQTRPGGRARRR